ncbi:MAG TPA: hypothetical protein P5571_06760 [Candidatus Krumholzibacteria bacterium]|nr:hypothetical protein [Candidatus Krumholzibacteria bacterium]HRX51044.1 hypothetical protein [Candidatus Krumholzibacteria bacterium]
MNRLLVAGLLLLATVADAHDAAEFADTSPRTPDAVRLEQVLSAMESGQVLRVHASGVVQEGTFVTRDGGDVLLDTVAGRVRIPVDGIRGLAAHGRFTGWAARRGAVGGGILLGAYGLMLGAVISADDDGSVPVLGAIGLVGGAVAGGAVGGLAGAAFPRWRVLWGVLPRDAVEPREDSAVTGGFALGAGWSAALGGAGDGGLAWQAQLRIRTSSGLAHGLELMHARPGPARQEYPSPPGGAPAFEPAARLTQAGWRAEMPLVGAASAMAPFLSGGVGTYFWQDTYLGYSLGAGLRVEPRPGRSGLVLEARRHDNLQNLTETDPAHWTATASLAWSW